MAEAQDGGNLFGGLRQRDRERDLAIGRQAVGLIRFQAQGFGDQAGFGQQSAEAGDNAVASGHHVGLRVRLTDHGARLLFGMNLRPV